MIHRRRVHLFPWPTIEINIPERDDPDTRWGPAADPAAHFCAAPGKLSDAEFCL